MSSFYKASPNCYCAFCKSPRRIYRKKNISAMNFMASLMVALVVSFVIWQTVDPRAIIVFVIFLALSETFIQIRWRLSVVCGICGFDPILYIKDHQAAAEKVKIRLEKRKEDPNYLLAKPLNIPIMAPEPKAQINKTELNTKGRLVSRSV